MEVCIQPWLTLMLSIERLCHLHCAQEGLKFREVRTDLEWWSWSGLQRDLSLGVWSLDATLFPATGSQPSKARRCHHTQNACFAHHSFFFFNFRTDFFLFKINCTFHPLLPLLPLLQLFLFFFLVHVLCLLYSLLGIWKGIWKKHIINFRTKNTNLAWMSEMFCSGF